MAKPLVGFLKGQRAGVDNRGGMFSAPSAQRFRTHGTAVRAATLVALVWGAGYLGWRITDTWAGSQPALFVVLFVCELFGWVTFAAFGFLAWRVPARVRPPLRRRPTADVFVCTYNEGLDVLAATLVGCDRIRSPHTTYVLDDGRRSEVAALAERYGARYVTRADNRHAKAGNINHALPLSDGEVILVLDADHVPQPDILDATLGYFDDPSVALVQTPHDFGNHDSFQHFQTGRHDQSLFFEVIMPGKDRHNGAFWCGSAAVLLRRALERVGGIATETVAEDFHTSIRLHAAGFTTRYHDETLVQGLAPHDLATFLLQRDRWARGNLAVLRTKDNPLVARGLRLKQRASYLASLLGYFLPLHRLVLVAVLLSMLVGGFLPLHATAAQFAVFWVPWMALDLAASTLLCRGRTSLWDGTYSTLLTSEIFTRAVCSLVHPFRTSFRVTPKDGIDSGGWTAARQLRLMLVVGGALVVAVALRLAVVAGATFLPSLPPLAVGAGLAFAAWELLQIGAALARVTRRRQMRHHYRVPVEIAGVMDRTLVRVVDLTPGGAGVIAPTPLEVGAEVSLELDLATVDGELRRVHVRLASCSCRRDNGFGWRVGGTLVPDTPADGELLIEYCHLVSTRARLAESGRLRPGMPLAPAGTQVREPAVPRIIGA